MDKHAHAGHEGHGHSHPQSESKVSTDTAGLKDPVCGMTVTEQSPHHVQHEGRPYYFCSAKCLAKFSAEPAKYVQAADLW